MGKHTSRQYMTFTKAHIAVLLDEYYIQSCDDLHALLEEWSLQEFDDTDTRIWRYRASVCYRLRDYGNRNKRQKKQDSEVPREQKPNTPAEGRQAEF